MRLPLAVLLVFSVSTNADLTYEIASTDTTTCAVDFTETQCSVLQQQLDPGWVGQGAGTNGMYVVNGISSFPGGCFRIINYGNDPGAVQWWYNRDLDSPNTGGCGDPNSSDQVRVCYCNDGTVVDTEVETTTCALQGYADLDAEECADYHAALGFASSMQFTGNGYMAYGCQRYTDPSTGAEPMYLYFNNPGQTNPSTTGAPGYQPICKYHVPPSPPPPSSPPSPPSPPPGYGLTTPLDRGVSCANAGLLNITDEALCLGLASQLTPPASASSSWLGSINYPYGCFVITVVSGGSGSTVYWNPRTDSRYTADPMIVSVWEMNMLCYGHTPPSTPPSSPPPSPPSPPPGYGLTTPLDRGVSCANAGLLNITDEALCLGLASQLTPPASASGSWSGSINYPYGCFVITVVSGGSGSTVYWNPRTDSQYTADPMIVSVWEINMLCYGHTPPSTPPYMPAATILPGTLTTQVFTQTTFPCTNASGGGTGMTFRLWNYGDWGGYGAGTRPFAFSKRNGDVEDNGQITLAYPLGDSSYPATMDPSVHYADLVPTQEYCELTDAFPNPPGLCLSSLSSASGFFFISEGKTTVDSDTDNKRWLTYDASQERTDADNFLSINGNVLLSSVAAEATPLGGGLFDIEDYLFKVKTTDVTLNWDSPFYILTEQGNCLVPYEIDSTSGAEAVRPRITVIPCDDTDPTHQWTRECFPSPPGKKLTQTHMHILPILHFSLSHCFFLRRCSTALDPAPGAAPGGSDLLLHGAGALLHWLHWCLPARLS
jgi:hypothetical protein